MNVTNYRRSLIGSSLSIVPVMEEHHGQWNCLLVSVYGNRSKSINMIVISERTRYCPLAGELNKIDCNFLHIFLYEEVC